MQLLLTFGLRVRDSLRGWEGQQLIGSLLLLGRNSKSCVADGGCVFGPDHMSSRWCLESEMQVQGSKNGVQGMVHTFLQTCHGVKFRRSGALADCRAQVCSVV